MMFRRSTSAHFAGAIDSEAHSSLWFFHRAPRRPIGPESFASGRARTRRAQVPRWHAELPPVVRRAPRPRPPVAAFFPSSESSPPGEAHAKMQQRARVPRAVAAPEQDAVHESPGRSLGRLWASHRSGPCRRTNNQQHLRRSPMLRGFRGDFGAHRFVVFSKEAARVRATQRSLLRAPTTNIDSFRFASLCQCFGVDTAASSVAPKS